MQESLARLGLILHAGLHVGVVGPRKTMPRLQGDEPNYWSSLYLESRVCNRSKNLSARVGLLRTLLTPRTFLAIGWDCELSHLANKVERPNPRYRKQFCISVVQVWYWDDLSHVWKLTSQMFDKRMIIYFQVFELP